MKQLRIKKTAIILSIITLLTAGASALDLSLHLYPVYEAPLNNFMNKAGGFGGNVGIDIAPVSLRGRDKIFISGEFTYSVYPVEGLGIQSLFDGALGLGYNFRINDRFAVFPEVYAGLWSFNTSDAANIQSASGLVFGGRVGGEFYLGPAFSLSAFGGFKTYYTRPSPFMNNFELGIGIRYSLSRGLFSSNKISMEENEVEPLFPVFFSHYSDNPFGHFTFVNNEENDIYDVEVSILVDSFMTTPYTIYQAPQVGRGESFEVSACALFNENILELIQPKSSDLEVTVTYYSIGKKQTSTYNIPVTALSRNSMTWEDDRRAAAFVSGRDATAQRFARLVKTAVRNNLRKDIPENVQYAAAIFGALKAFGINYVVDPSSAFTDNVGTAAVDFLQFPYQTLLYHGGDCDDLTILNCSLLEALGIETAFITVPGHIYMAFDSGLSADKIGSVRKGYYIAAEGKLWVPVEITLSQDTFSLAWSYGAREWRKAGENAALIPLKNAWSLYLPISVPDSDVNIDMPSQDILIKHFTEARYY